MSNYKIKVSKMATTIQNSFLNFCQKQKNCRECELSKNENLKLESCETLYTIKELIDFGLLDGDKFEF